jgi:hypothetical protein
MENYIMKDKGDKIYQYDLDVTGITDYGLSLDAILSGKETPPLQRVHIDVAKEEKYGKS